MLLLQNPTDLDTPQNGETHTKTLVRSHYSRSTGHNTRRRRRGLPLNNYVENVETYSLPLLPTEARNSAGRSRHATIVTVLDLISRRTGSERAADRKRGGRGVPGRGIFRISSLLSGIIGVYARVVFCFPIVRFPRHGPSVGVEKRKSRLGNKSNFSDSTCPVRHQQFFCYFFFWFW